MTSSAPTHTTSVHISALPRERQQILSSFRDHTIFVAEEGTADHQIQSGDAGMQPDDPLAERLLDVVSTTFDQLRRRTAGGIPLAAPLTGEAAARLSHRSLLLWLLSTFVGIVAEGRGGTQARVTILAPAPADKRVLHSIAASDRPPWVSSAEGQIPMRLGQLLPGYSSGTSLALATAETDAPFRRLVPPRAAEAPGDTFTPRQVVTVPVPTRLQGDSSVLHLALSDPITDLDTTMRALQVIATIAGELLQHTLDMTYTVHAASEAARLRYLSVKHLRSALSAAIGRLLDESASGAVPHADDRIAFVVISSSASDSALDHQISSWLGEQLRHLIPRNILPTSVQTGPNGLALVHGALSAHASLLMIPARLDKVALDELRRSVPTWLNSMPDAFLSNGEPVARLNAWIVDAKWRDAHSAHGDLNRFVEQVLELASAAADVLEFHIAGYHHGFEKGDWSRALAFIKEGLERAPRNAYLLRRAAEFSIYVGDFTGAERYARLAAETGEAPITSRCLLGDSLLGQGRVRAAVHEYRTAAREDGNHPLPHYSEGLALLAVARLLRTEGDQVARAMVLSQSTGAGRKKVDARDNSQARGLANIERHSAQLCERASAAHRAAQVRLRRRGKGGVQIAAGAIDAHNLLALSRTESMRLNPSGAVQELASARSDWPRDDAIARELFFVRMWHSGMAQRLWKAYATHDSLEGVHDDAIPDLLTVRG